MCTAVHVLYMYLLSYKCNVPPPWNGFFSKTSHPLNIAIKLDALPIPSVREEWIHVYSGTAHPQKITPTVRYSVAYCIH